MIFSDITLAAIDIAKKAGDYIASRESGNYKIDEKLSSYDYVTDVDTSAEAMIRDLIEERFPGHSFIGEESGISDTDIERRISLMSDNDYCWLVDPLDGTINFIHGLGVYGVSIGVLKGGRVISGVIYLPTRNELYYAEEGKGAWCNDKPISVSSCCHMKDSLINYSLPSINMGYRKEVLDFIEPLSMNCFNLRIVGAASAALAYVACGRLEAYIELGHHPWDIAAGMLLIKEAGGILRNYNSEELSLFEPRMVVSNGKIHKELTEIINNETNL